MRKLAILTLLTLLATICIIIPLAKATITTTATAYNSIILIGGNTLSISKVANITLTSSTPLINQQLNLTIIPITKLPAQIRCAVVFKNSTYTFGTATIVIGPSTISNSTTATVTYTTTVYVIAYCNITNLPVGKYLFNVILFNQTSGEKLSSTVVEKDVEIGLWVDVSPRFIPVKEGGYVTVVIYGNGTVGNDVVNVTIPSGVEAVYYGYSYKYVGPGQGDGVTVNWNPATKSLIVSDVDQYEKVVAKLFLNTTNVGVYGIIVIITTPSGYKYNYTIPIVFYNKSITLTYSTTYTPTANHENYTIETTIQFDNGVPSGVLPSANEIIVYPYLYNGSVVTGQLKSINVLEFENPTVKASMTIFAGKVLLANKSLTTTYMNMLTSTPTLKAIINASTLTPEQKEALEKQPNVTVTVVVSDSLGYSSKTVEYRVLDILPPRISGFALKFNTTSGRVFNVLKENGIYIVPNTSTQFIMYINVSAYRNIKHDNVTLPYPVAILLPPVAYINGTETTSISCTIEKPNMTIGETGVNITEFKCVISVSNLKALNNISIKFSDNCSRYVWFNITVEKKYIPPPTPPTYTPVKEVGYVVGVANLTAKSEIGIYEYNITIILPRSNYTILIPKSVIDRSEYVLYLSNGSSYVLESLLTPGNTTLYSMKEMLKKNGSLIVGYGEIIVVPPARVESVKMIIRAIDYAGEQSNATTVEISYGVTPDAYYILYLPAGWDAFSIPGVLVGAWNNILKDVAKYVVEAFRIPTGPFTMITPCNLATAKPEEVIGYEVKPYTFIVYASRDAVFVIPVVYYTEVGLPYRITVNVKADMYNLIPAALQLEAVNITRIAMPREMQAWIYAWDVEAHRFVPVATYMYGTWYTTIPMTLPIVPLGTPLVLFTVESGTVTVLPT